MKQNKTEALPKYSIDEVNAVGEWQEYGSSLDKQQLKIIEKLLPNLPRNAKVCNQPVFRVLALKVPDLDKLVKGKQLKHYKYESWATTLAAVKNYINYQYHLKNGDVSVILKHRPMSSEVFVNIAELWKDKEWRSSVKYWEENTPVERHGMRIWLSEGLELTGTQKEVVLSRSSFTINDVVGCIYKRNVKNISSKKEALQHMEAALIQYQEHKVGARPFSKLEYQ